MSGFVERTGVGDAIGASSSLLAGAGVSSGSRSRTHEPEACLKKDRI